MRLQGLGYSPSLGARESGPHVPTSRGKAGIREGGRRRSRGGRAVPPGPPHALPPSRDAAPLGSPLALLTCEQAGSVQAPHLNTFQVLFETLGQRFIYEANYMLQQHSQNAKDLQLTLGQRRFELVTAYS